MPLYKQAWLWIILFAVLLSGGIIWTRSDLEMPAFLEKEEDIAMRVNGSVVTKEEFMQNADLVIAQYQSSGMEIDREEVKNSVVDWMVEEIILFDYLEERNIEITEEEMKALYDEQKKQMEGMMSMEDYPSFEEEKEEIEIILKIQKLLEIYGEDVDVSEEEVQNAYDNQVAQMEQMEMGDDIPSFEEAKSDIERRLIQEKAGGLITETLEKIKEEAEIEIFIELEDIEIPEQAAPEFDVPEGE